jgi:hypothetical protein
MQSELRLTGGNTTVRESVSQTVNFQTLNEAERPRGTAILDRLASMENINLKALKDM